eukprot:TRINITY_DN9483_c0_g1_i1.p1 TRINITY_DN9483_c0_g1~~TRINITY_DN9483_c0_g1_i1.p1  ORF type:complete len:242 (-),score=34.93 TRINITY_DN9483_c0_g1_i1:99-824(-)
MPRAPKLSTRTQPTKTTAKLDKPETTPKTKTAAKRPATKHNHPSYEEMICRSIASEGKRTGSSRQAILRYISDNYDVPKDTLKTQLKLALGRLVHRPDGQPKLLPVKGSFRISPELKKKYIPASFTASTASKKETNARKVTKSPEKATKNKQEIATTSPTKATKIPKKAIKTTKSPRKATSPKKVIKTTKSPKKATKSPKKVIETMKSPKKVIETMKSPKRTGTSKKVTKTPNKTAIYKKK